MKKLILSFALSLSAFHAAPVLAQEPDLAALNIAEIDFGAPEPLSITSGEDVHEFSVEVADTFEKRQRGLMFRNSLAPNAGMLFEFETVQVASIWMKNTAIPLDILFVRKDGSIAKIVHSHQPYSLRSVTSEAPVAAVVEIPGGRAYELGIEPGDYVTHEFFVTP